MDNEMQTCNMDERTNEEKLSDMVDGLIAERDKYRLALEEIKRHVELSVGTVAKYSAVYHIANKALEDK